MSPWSTNSIGSELFMMDGMPRGVHFKNWVVSERIPRGLSGACRGRVGQFPFQLRQELTLHSRPGSDSTDLEHHVRVSPRHGESLVFGGGEIVDVVVVG